jgi:tRNA (guanine-N7-)-methyltransferase
MARSKLRKFIEIEQNPKIIEPSKANYKEMKGKWAEFFGNSNPIVLELACGYGEYTNALAAENPEKNYIGVDIKGERIWHSNDTSEELGLVNTRYLRAQIEFLSDFFNAGEVSEIWIIHPDPFPRVGDSKHRLTSPEFIKIYRDITKPGAKFFLKTDDLELFEYSLLQLGNSQKLEFTYDLHNSKFNTAEYQIETRFERKALLKGLKINFASWSF